ncbi:Recombinase zinc beta ribbon domain-containing protein [Clostridium cavendishii DSM 21758]|uniref:Recombinase zinc beta ribbon domain-containing protein n=1 Tax=Clostridium cavendishii DSM 21758 TaxID=1121302 RepID=A0A1M6NCD1_9CLOT|nr:recombinase family protein [Clostridium cavendishii]SHJ93372.1 Recombinase zinc beta ribbon domain-containing protein [Clostridium cavendishii DSM 21758]
MIAAIYSRKSIFTGKGDSVENQVQMCKEYAEKNLNISEFLIYEDEGFSGGNINRPKFQKLLKDIKEKKFNCLICYRLDRISRNVSDFSSTLELLEEYNISFVSIKEQFDTSTPMGKAMVYISSVFAQLERETIAERVRDNMLELAKSGRWLGGQTPLGFGSEKVTFFDNEFKERTMYQLIPIEDELNLVKLIFNKYSELKSLRKVNQYLLENNFKTKQGANWNVRAISDLLTSPTYVRATKTIFSYLESKGISCVGTPNSKNGILTYNKKKGKKSYRSTEEWIAAIARHEGIIPATEWLNIQKTLKENKSKAPRLGKTHNALLTGILKCGHCGSPMTVIHGDLDANGNKRLYYVCSMKIYSKRTRCNNGNLRTIDIEKVVLDKLKEITVDNGLLIKELEKFKLQNHINTENIEVENIKKSIKDNEVAIETLIKQLAEDETSTITKYVVAEVEKREKSIKELKLKLSQALEKQTNVSSYYENIDYVINTIRNFYSNICFEDFEVKKFIISSLIDKITWDSPTGTVEINLWGS